MYWEGIKPDGKKLGRNYENLFTFFLNGCYQLCAMQLMFHLSSLFLYMPYVHWDRAHSKFSLLLSSISVMLKHVYIWMSVCVRVCQCMQRVGALTWQPHRRSCKHSGMCHLGERCTCRQTCCTPPRCNPLSAPCHHHRILDTTYWHNAPPQKPHCCLCLLPLSALPPSLDSWNGTLNTCPVLSLLPCSLHLRHIELRRYIHSSWDECCDIMLLLLQTRQDNETKAHINKHTTVNHSHNKGPVPHHPVHSSMWTEGLRERDKRTEGLGSVDGCHNNPLNVCRHIHTSAACMLQHNNAGNYQTVLKTIPTPQMLLD